jgi:enoyl-CoA hydratase
VSVIVEQQGAVLIVTLNRAAQPNALDGETMSGVGAALADAESDDSVAVVVLTGVGDRSFCAGTDLKVSLRARSRLARPMARDSAC